MTQPFRRRSMPLLVAFGTAFLPLISACNSATTATANPTASFAPGPETPGMPGGGPMPSMANMSMPTGDAATPVTPAGPNDVNITNFAFAPASLTVKVGTTVTWTNLDEEPHTVVSDDGSTFHSAGLGTGSVYTFTFTKAGTYQYICGIHPFMKATVVVTE